jgi:glutamate-1-semialdehyde 2,1-aminomutase
MRSLAKSNKHFERAVSKMPLGVSSNFRYWGDDKTIYVDHGKGARVWDIDGNEYIDYRLAYGPVILGYADERVDAAAREGMKVGGVFALSTELEYEVAKRISRMVRRLPNSCASRTRVPKPSWQLCASRGHIRVRMDT